MFDAAVERIAIGGLIFIVAILVVAIYDLYRRLSSARREIERLNEYMTDFNDLFVNIRQQAAEATINIWKGLIDDLDRRDLLPTLYSKSGTPFDLKSYLRDQLSEIYLNRVLRHFYPSENERKR
jgi:hypothetical protein